VSLIEAVENDTGAVHVIDVPNRGSYDFMDDDDVVEVKCRIDAPGAHPIIPSDSPAEGALGEAIRRAALYL